jgi:hypothetical protein
MKVTLDRSFSSYIHSSLSVHHSSFIHMYFSPSYAEMPRLLSSFTLPRLDSFLLRCYNGLFSATTFTSGVTASVFFEAGTPTFLTGLGEGIKKLKTISMTSQENQSNQSIAKIISEKRNVQNERSPKRIAMTVAAAAPVAGNCLRAATGSRTAISANS